MSFIDFLQNAASPFLSALSAYNREVPGRIWQDALNQLAQHNVGFGTQPAQGDILARAANTAVSSVPVLGTLGRFNAPLLGDEAIRQGLIKAFESGGNVTAQEYYTKERPLTELVGETAFDPLTWLSIVEPALGAAKAASIVQRTPALAKTLGALYSGTHTANEIMGLPARGLVATGKAAMAPVRAATGKLFETAPEGILQQGNAVRARYLGQLMAAGIPADQAAEFLGKANNLAYLAGKGKFTPAENTDFLERLGQMFEAHGKPFPEQFRNRPAPTPPVEGGAPAGGAGVTPSGGANGLPGAAPAAQEMGIKAEEVMSGYGVGIPGVGMETPGAYGAEIRNDIMGNAASKPTALAPQRPAAGAVAAVPSPAVSAPPHPWGTERVPLKDFLGDTSRYTPEELRAKLTEWDQLDKQWWLTHGRSPQLVPHLQTGWYQPDVLVEETVPWERHVSEWLSRQPVLPRHPSIPTEGVRPGMPAPVLVDPYGNVPPVLHQEMAGSKYAQVLSNWLQRAHDLLEDAVSKTSALRDYQADPSHFAGLEAGTDRLGVNVARVNVKVHREYRSVFVSPWGSLNDMLARQVQNVTGTTPQTVDKAVLVRDTAGDIVSTLAHELVHNVHKNDDAVFERAWNTVMSELKPTTEALTRELAGRLQNAVDANLDPFYTHTRKLAGLERPAKGDYLGDAYADEIFSERRAGSGVVNGNGLPLPEGGNGASRVTGPQGLLEGAAGEGSGRPAGIQRGPGANYPGWQAGTPDVGGVVGRVAPRSAGGGNSDLGFLSPASWPIAGASEPGFTQFGVALGRAQAALGKDRARAAGIAQKAAKALGIPADRVTLDDLTSSGVVGQADLAWIAKQRRVWGQQDFLRENPSALLMSKLHADESQALGIRPPNNWNNIMTLWRAQALIAPGYHVLNASDAAIKNAMHGVAPFTTSSHVNDMQAAWGQVDTEGNAIIPDAIKRNWLAYAYGNKPEAAWEKVPPAARALGGAALGAPGGPVGAGLGAAYGVALPKLETLNKTAAATIEFAARSSAWLTGKGRYIQKELPGFLAKAGPNSGALAAKNGIFSPADVLATTGNGRAVSEWQTILDKADAAGVALANHIHFDYSSATNLDSFLKNFTAFHFWAVRNVPFYLQHLAEMPGLATLFARYNEISGKANADANLTQRFSGTMPIGDRLATVLFGQSGSDIYVNPLYYLSILQQLPKRGSAEEGSPADIMNQLGAVGLSPNPLIQVAMRKAGMMGDQPMGTVFRASGPLGAVLGQMQGKPVNLEQPLQSALGAFDMNEYNVRKRIAEMSVEKTGAPNNPTYLAAMANPASPIRQQAEAEVARMNLGAGLASYMGVPPTKLLTDVEAQTRLARTNLPQRGDIGSPLDTARYSLAMRAAESANPLASTYSNVSPKDQAQSTAESAGRKATEDRIWKEWIAADPATRQQMWANPEVQFVVTKRTMESVVSPQRRQMTYPSSYTNNGR